MRNRTNNSDASARVLEPGQGCHRCTPAIVLILSNYLFPPRQGIDTFDVITSTEGTYCKRQQRTSAARCILKSSESEVFSRLFLMNFPVKSVYRHKYDPAFYRMFLRLAKPQKSGQSGKFSTSECIGKYNEYIRSHGCNSSCCSLFMGHANV